MYDPQVSRAEWFTAATLIILTERNKSVHENRIYSVNIHCGDSYPDTPPTIQFTSKVNIPCVDQRTGKVRHPMQKRAVLDIDALKVDSSKLPCLAQWRREYTMETILIELRRCDKKICALLFTLM